MQKCHVQRYLYSVFRNTIVDSLAIILSLVQLNNEFKDRAKLIMEHWNSPKRISLVDGHYVACDPADDDVRTLGETYSKELMFQEFESYRARDELLNFGFIYFDTKFVFSYGEFFECHFVLFSHEGHQYMI